jgi:hypothetical protein
MKNSSRNHEVLPAIMGKGLACALRRFDHILFAQPGNQWTVTKNTIRMRTYQDGTVDWPIRFTRVTALGEHPQGKSIRQSADSPRASCLGVATA